MLKSVFVRSSSLLGIAVAFGACQAQAEQVITDNIKLQTADSPQVTFEQTAGTYPAYTWRTGANETYFFISDMIAQNDPLLISAGAPDNSIFISTSGNVGFGTTVPTAGLHVAKLAQSSIAEAMAKFTVTDDTIGSLTIANHSTSNGVFIPKITGRAAGQNVAFMNEAVVGADAGTSPAIAYNVIKGAGGGVTTRPLVAYRNNNVAKVTIGYNGDVFATSFSPVSSRAKKHGIVDLDSGKAAEALRQLTPVEFVYNDDETAEKRIGFIAEDVPEIVANPDRQSVPIMDVVGLLTRVIKDQQKTIDDQQKRLETLERKLLAE